MPAAFLKCVKDGGRVRTMSGPDKKMGLSENQFVRVCFKGGKMSRGEIKTKQSVEVLKEGPR